MISVVPADWQFLFLGSDESLEHIQSSLAIQRHQSYGKLELKRIPEYNSSWPVIDKKNHMFADMSFYNLYLHRAEWLLDFQADSILCAVAGTTLNDWLKYDWLGSLE